MNVAAIIDHEETTLIINDMKKDDDDHSNVISMTNHAEEALIVDNTEKSDNVFSDGVWTINATADSVSMINTTADGVLMIDDTVTKNSEETKNDNNIEQLLSFSRRSDCMTATLMVEFDRLSTMVEIMLAPDRSSTYNDYAPSLCPCLRNPPHVYVLQPVAREGTACGITNISFDESPVGFMKASSGDADMAHMVYCLQTSSMAESKHFAHRQLKSFENWPDWGKVLDAQLGFHCKVDCI